ncbi:MAG: glutamate--cysteine ligase [Nitrospinae bacterium]|nr:glutamate--cysteine ligase [Nitrospinota bacterium]
MENTIPFCGFELEYMVVRKNDCTVLPIVDQLLTKKHGSLVNEVEAGEYAWSNELAGHVIEIKTIPPVVDFRAAANRFQEEVVEINHLLHEFDAKLLPSGAHPFMNPHREASLWKHGNRRIYETYNRIFDCRGHGWVNLQSVHLNIPYSKGNGFGRLHAAIRALMPIIPALCASTPYLDGVFTGFLDARLETYRKNQQRIPTVAGNVIPESIRTQKEYRERILQPMYVDILGYDPKKVLAHEWLNSRGVIARFSRRCLEIKIIDILESPGADMAAASLIVATLEALMAEKWSSLNFLFSLSDEILVPVYHNTVKQGSKANLPKKYLRCFGVEQSDEMSAGNLWKHIAQNIDVEKGGFADEISILLKHGSLSERMMQFAGTTPDHKRMVNLCEKLSSSLASGTFFKG